MNLGLVHLWQECTAGRHGGIRTPGRQDGRIFGWAGHVRGLSVPAGAARRRAARSGRVQAQLVGRQPRGRKRERQRDRSSPRRMGHHACEQQPAATHGLHHAPTHSLSPSLCQLLLITTSSGSGSPGISCSIVSRVDDDPTGVSTTRGRSVARVVAVRPSEPRIPLRRHVMMCGDEVDAHGPSPSTIVIVGRGDTGGAGGRPCPHPPPTPMAHPSSAHAARVASDQNVHERSCRTDCTSLQSRTRISRQHQPITPRESAITLFHSPKLMRWVGILAIDMPRPALPSFF